MIAGSTNGNVDGIGNMAQFGSIGGISIDQSNHILYVADKSSSWIRKIDLLTNSVQGILSINYVNGVTFDETNNFLYYTAQYCYYSCSNHQV